MTEYQPGRIYSGVVNGTRRLLFCGEDDQTEFSWVNDHGMLRFSPKNGVIPTDVRGPLVVLDLDETVANGTLQETVRLLRNSVTTQWIADVIEAQTRPPIQVGWHETDRLDRPMWWDGERWTAYPGGQTYEYVRSLAYLGKGTRA